ncbi:MAG: hypothetical protein DYG83_04585 [Candidatus Brocadia sp. AMX2]|nr:MAG: hypothetical protein EDM70_10150 [Candidatus Brocadia sp. AMX2]MBC6931879.1 hypothetical protein [Candidatus Brocadia sp.]MBL1168356.1 hypothetical protein [Candidatus Brocadia sp. AMX1]MCE7866097.1 hypothetical protein [Candidatus Brocadia sp. AMX2]MCQ3916965.1 hypothetical protein [Candidatus Brocadia sp.]
MFYGRFFRLTQYRICCTITKFEESFKVIDSEMITEEDNMQALSQIEKNHITSLIRQYLHDILSNARDIEKFLNGIEKT